jgi:hypothetical protein
MHMPSVHIVCKYSCIHMCLCVRITPHASYYMPHFIFRDIYVYIYVCMCAYIYMYVGIRTTQTHIYIKYMHTQTYTKDVKICIHMHYPAVINDCASAFYKYERICSSSKFVQIHTYHVGLDECLGLLGIPINRHRQSPFKGFLVRKRLIRKPKDASDSDKERTIGTDGTYGRHVYCPLNLKVWDSLHVYVCGDHDSLGAKHVCVYVCCRELNSHPVRCKRVRLCDLERLSRV